MTRLFVAIWPTAEASQLVRSLPREGWEGVRWTPESNWHITLTFLGEAEIATVASSLAAADLPRATAVVGSRVRTMGATSLVVLVSGVDDLACAVQDATDAPERRFHGHLTVARSVGRRRITGRPTTGTPGAPGKTESVRFDVTEVALVASTLSPAGAVYETVATFPTVSRRDDGR